MPKIFAIHDRRSP